MECRIRDACPELLDVSLQTNLFTPAASDSNPSTMATAFGVPYLGKLPMDPNMMRACEEGYSFLQLFPNSVASAPFASIVNKILTATNEA